MLNNLDAVKTNFKYNIPGGFRHYSTFNKPGVGEVTILRNSEAFILSKTITNEFLDPSDKFIAQLKKIAIPIRGVQKFEGFDQNTQQGVLRPIFSFCSDLLNLIHQEARDNKKPISETVIWKVYQDVGSALKVLEQTGLFHPFVSIDNIFFQDGTFKLTNPFLFDSFLKELKVLAAADPQTFAQKIKDKQLENSTQLGYSLMQLASLVTDEEIQDGVKYKKDNLRECMRVSNTVYSPDLNTTIEKLIKGKEGLAAAPSQNRQNLLPSKINTEPSAENSLLGRNKLIEPKPQDPYKPNSVSPLDRSFRPNLTQASFGPAIDAQQVGHMPGDFVPRGAPKPSATTNKPLISPEPVVSQVVGEVSKPAPRPQNNTNESEVFAHDLKNKQLSIGQNQPAEQPENSQNVSHVNDGREQSRGKLSRWVLDGEHGGLNETSFVDPKQPIIRNDISSIRKQPKVFFQDDSSEEQIQKQKQTAEFSQPNAEAPNQTSLREPAATNASKQPFENSRAANPSASNIQNQSRSSFGERRRGNVTGYIFKDMNMNDQSLMEQSRFTDRNVLPPNINQTVLSSKVATSTGKKNPASQSQYYMPPTSLPHLNHTQQQAEQPRISELKNLLFADNQSLHEFSRNSVLDFPVRQQDFPTTHTYHSDRLLHPHRSGLQSVSPHQPQTPNPAPFEPPSDTKSHELKRLLFEENLNDSQNDLSSIDYGRQSIRTTGSLAREILRDMHVPLNYVPDRVPYTEEPSEEFFLDPRDEPAAIIVDFNKPRPQPMPQPLPEAVQGPPPETRPPPRPQSPERWPRTTTIPSDFANGYLTHTYHRLPYSHPMEIRVIQEVYPYDPSQHRPQPPAPEVSPAQPVHREPSFDRSREKLNRSVYRNIISVFPDDSIHKRAAELSAPPARPSLPKQILSFTQTPVAPNPKPQTPPETKFAAAPPPVRPPAPQNRPLSPSTGSNPLKRPANFPVDMQKTPNRRSGPSSPPVNGSRQPAQQLAAASGARPH